RSSRLRDGRIEGKNHRRQDRRRYRRVQRIPGTPRGSSAARRKPCPTPNRLRTGGGMGLSGPLIAAHRTRFNSSSSTSSASLKFIFNESAAVGELAGLRRSSGVSGFSRVYAPAVGALLN